MVTAQSKQTESVTGAGGFHPLSRKGLPAFPNGWYAVGFSAELPPGAILTRRFMDQEVVLFRTESGALGVIDPYCPHLGAHLGRGSDVVGETIRCPFHYFCFDTQGRCTATGYGTKPPPKAIVRALTARERNGLLLIWHHVEDQPPTWEVPELSPEEYSPLIWREWELESHPQETTENSVDIGHLTVVHKYDSVEMLRDLVTDGPYLTARYAMRRPAPIMGGLIRNIRSEFEIHVYGLGYSQVNVVVPRFGLTSRLFVLATPTGVNTITLRVATSTRRLQNPRPVHPLLGLIPPLLVLPILNKAMALSVLDGLAHDVQQDFEIWQHKVYFSPPILADGDGPVGRYRQWVKQFYSGPITIPALMAE